jgi:hypothetical protein
MKRTAEADASAATAPSTDPKPVPVAGPVSLPAPPRLEGARYGDDLEARYVKARDAWTHAMQIASSGRPADMASLAIAQQTYEAIAAERDQWRASGRVAIPIQPGHAPKRHDIEIAVGQELAWRRVQEADGRGGLFSRIRRRLSRH